MPFLPWRPTQGAVPPACRMFIQHKSPLYCELTLTQLCSVTVALWGPGKGVLELFPASLHFILKVYKILNVKML